MDLYGLVRDFIDDAIKYIELLTNYLRDFDITDLLIYLYSCFPEEVKAVIYVFIVFSIILGIRSSLRG